jgi:hypothetical protein
VPTCSIAGHHAKCANALYALTSSPAITAKQLNVARLNAREKISGKNTVGNSSTTSLSSGNIIIPRGSDYMGVHLSVAEAIRIGLIEPEKRSKCRNLNSHTTEVA